MTGTPRHAERVHRSEGDKRRYKGRCKYFNYENDYCSKRCGRCMGSAHCDEYDALTDEKFQKKQKRKKAMTMMFTGIRYFRDVIVF